MAIRIEIPQSQGAITLRQYVDYFESKDDVEKVRVITGKSRVVIEAFKMDVVREIINVFELALTLGTGKLQKRIKLADGELGFIPDLTSMTLAEYIDLDTYAQDCYKGNELNHESIIKMMGVLYRPIAYQAGDYYELEAYNSDRVHKYEHLLYQIDMDAVYGMLVFFSALENKLLEAIPEFLAVQQQAMMKELNTMK